MGPLPDGRMVTKSHSKTLISRFLLAAVLAAGFSAGALADDAAAPAVVPVPAVGETVSIVVSPGAVAAESVDPAAAISTEVPASSGPTGSGEELSLSPYGNGPAGDCPHHRHKVALVPTS